MAFLLCMLFGHRNQVAGTYHGAVLRRCKTCGRYSTESGEVKGRFE